MMVVVRQKSLLNLHLDQSYNIVDVISSNDAVVMGEEEKVGAELVLNGLMVINVVTIESQPSVV